MSPDIFPYQMHQRPDGLWIEVDDIGRQVGGDVYETRNKADFQRLVKSMEWLCNDVEILSKDLDKTFPDDEDKPQLPPKKGDKFNWFGQIWEVVKVFGRDRISMARPVADAFGKIALIDHRSFHIRDLSSMDKVKDLSWLDPTRGGSLVPPPQQGLRKLRRRNQDIKSIRLKYRYSRKGAFDSVQKAGQWLARKWTNLEGRYGRKPALAMAIAMVATFPLPGNVIAVVGVAEGIRGLHGYFARNFPEVKIPRLQRDDERSGGSGESYFSECPRDDEGHCESRKSFEDKEKWCVVTWTRHTGESYGPERLSEADAHAAAMRERERFAGSGVSFYAAPVPDWLKSLRYRIKAGSYFSECPRDDEGHCKPSGEGDEAGKEEKPKKEPKERKPEQEDAKAVEKQWTNSWVASLEDEEREAISDYTLNSDSINSKLRSGTLGGKDSYTVMDLDAALDKSQTPHDMTVYRGLLSDPEWETEETIEDLGYTSTTKYRETAESFAKKRGVIVEVVIPKGSAAARIPSNLSGYSNEDEVLIARDSRFKVSGKRVEKGRTIYQVIADTNVPDTEVKIPKIATKDLSWLDPTRGEGHCESRKSLRYRVKAGSYFAECPRDDEGHCKPKGEGDEAGKEKPKKEKKPKEKPKQEEQKTDFAAIASTMEEWNSKKRTMGCVAATNFFTSRVPGFKPIRKVYYTEDGTVYEHVVATNGQIEIDLAPYANKPEDVIMRWEDRFKKDDDEEEDEKPKQVKIPKIKNLSYLTKDSYFAECERDEGGQCLPSGRAGESKPDQQKPKQEKPQEDKRKVRPPKIQSKPKQKKPETKKPRVKEQKPNDKAEIARKSAKRVDKEIQRYAEEHNEPLIAKALGGQSYPNSEPIDVGVKRKDGSFAYGIELKTMVDNGNNKITMKREAMERKAKWEKENKAEVHTVVLDDSVVFAECKGDHVKCDVSKRKIFYRRGYGSFRVGTMHQVKDMDELKKLLETENDKLPESARRSK